MSGLVLSLSSHHSPEAGRTFSPSQSAFNLDDKESRERLNALFSQKETQGVMLRQSTEVLLPSAIDSLRSKIHASKKISPESNVLAHRILDRLEKHMPELPPATAEKIQVRVLDLLGMHMDSDIAYWVCGATSRDDLYRMITEPAISEIADVYNSWSRQEITMLFEILYGKKPKSPRAPKPCTRHAA
jgi:hypothetical protein